MLTPGVSRDLNEFVIVPGYATRRTTPDQVDLSGYIGNLRVPVAILSAPMESVGGEDLLIGLAQYGGLGVVPRKPLTRDGQQIPHEDVDAIANRRLEIVRRVKGYKAGFVNDLTTVHPDDSLQKVIELEQSTGHGIYPVVDNDGKFVGLLTRKKYNRERDNRLPVKDRMLPAKDVEVGHEGISLEDANQRLLQKGYGILPIVDGNGYLRSGVFWRDMEEHRRFPHEFIDAKKRLRVAAAISTFESDDEVAKELVKAGVDVLVIDTGQGNSEYVVDAIKRHKPLGVPLVAGNVADAGGATRLAAAGADAVKVGQSPGRVCTTRSRKRTGRGQATAIDDCSRALKDYNSSHSANVGLIADGGIYGPGLMAVAFRFGGTHVMAGTYFGQMEECASPAFEDSVVSVEDGAEITRTARVKTIWGEASERGRNPERYGGKDPRRMVIEGTDRNVQVMGSLHKILPTDIETLRSTIGNCGAGSVSEFHNRGVLEELSRAAMEKS